MLYELIKENRELLLVRSAKLIELGGGYNDLQTVALGHVSIFLDQLTDALLVEHGSPSDSAKSLVMKGSEAPAVQLSHAALDHGQEIRDSKLTISTLVRNYGSICQAITGYALEIKAPIDVAEFKTLNWCLDEAIAQAVIAYTTPAPPDAASLEAAKLKHDSRVDDMANLTHHIHQIAGAIAAIRTGRVGIYGATGELLDANLNAMLDLIERSIEKWI